MTRFGALAFAGLLVLTPLAAHADPAATLERWYDALAQNDAEAVASLLADDAKIVLEDLGVDQSKAEFVESLDGFADALDGGSLRHKLVSSDDANAVALVCYDFPGNAMLVRESFDFSGDLIVKSVQKQDADNCDAF